ncbi:MAG: hypothetical protein WAN11_11250 [Syntrophobacteraceae bacterium]
MENKPGPKISCSLWRFDVSLALAYRTSTRNIGRNLTGSPADLFINTGPYQATISPPEIARTGSLDEIIEACWQAANETAKGKILLAFEPQSTS